MDALLGAPTPSCYLLDVNTNLGSSTNKELTQMVSSLVSLK